MITLKKTINGTFIGSDKDSIQRLQKISVGEVIRVKPEKRDVRQKRSTRQNSYYWAVVIGTLENSLEQGLDGEQIHTALKCGCFGTRRVFGCCDMPRKSTSELSTVEMEDYLKWVREWASEVRGIYIPLPNETEYDYEL